MSVQANNKKANPEGQNYLEEILSTTGGMAKSGMEQSFLQGTNSFLSALQEGGSKMDKWLVNTGGAVGSIFYPNTVSSISKANDDYNRETRGIDNAETFTNTWKTKLFQGDKLPTKVNLWGEPIKPVPPESNKYVYYLLDVTKSKRVPINSFNYKIYDLWNTTQDESEKKKILPNLPPNYLIKNKEKVVLTPKQYETFQQYVGKNRATLVKNYTSTPEWETDSPELKLKKLTHIYENGLKSAKRQFMFENPTLFVK